MKKKNPKRIPTPIRTPASLMLAAQPIPPTKLNIAHTIKMTGKKVRLVAFGEMQLSKMGIGANPIKSHKKAKAGLR